MWSRQTEKSSEWEKSVPWLDRDKAGGGWYRIGNYPRGKQRVSDLPMVTQPQLVASRFTSRSSDPHFKATAGWPFWCPKAKSITWEEAKEQKMACQVFLNHFRSHWRQGVGKMGKPAAKRAHCSPGKGRLSWLDPAPRNLPGLTCGILWQCSWPHEDGRSHLKRGGCSVRTASQLSRGLPTQKAS